jgi:Dyp-type peroxidase family
MQGLVLSAYQRLDRAQYLLFAIRNVDQARQWLGKIARIVTPARRLHRFNSDGDGGYATTSVNVAFTASGLARLSGRVSLGDPLTPDLLTSALPEFPYPFVEGMGYGEHRARILASVGDSAPEKWRWGGPRNEPIDILLCVFVGGTDRELEAAVDAVMPPPSAASEVGGLPPTAPQAAADPREHFGFADGLSQPILVGSTEAQRYPDSRHLTAVGEIVCGYSDAAGVTTPAPNIDPNDGFGRNGTYLVLCQFYQDVAAFRQKALDAANGDAALALAIQTKIVGRHHDGTPLVPYTTADNNEFGFAEDPYGYGCPLGAHIRRANPRDSFDNNNVPPTPPIAQNRHRILRRGRKYGPPLLPEASTLDDGQDRGLFFLCLNADIERQFEFIQQNWINNPSLFGLGDERDPLIGGARDVPSCPFTIPMLPAPVRLDGLKRFIRLDGGQYFFLPGIAALNRLARTNRLEPAVVDADTLIGDIERQLRSDYASPHIRRDAHPKMHGLVQAVLHVDVREHDPRSRADLLQGIFADPNGTYPVWVRFSNGFGIQHDLEFEARGMAIKVMNVVPGDRERHQDFLLVTHDAFFLPNVEHYREFFAAAHSDDAAAVPMFFLRNRILRGGWALARSSFVLAANPLAITYFSQSVFKLGERFVKIRARPRLTPALRAALPAAWRFRLKTILANAVLIWKTARAGRARAEAMCEAYFGPRDQLRLAMMSFLAGHDAVFDIDVQLWDREAPPVDDPTRSWSEADAPYHHVATLTIPRQAFWPLAGMPPAVRRATEELVELGEDISFSPFHTLPAHRPVGSINEARREVYEQIARFRQRGNRVRDPKPQLFDEYVRLMPAIRGDAARV